MRPVGDEARKLHGAFGRRRTLLLTVVQPEKESAADAVFVAALLNLTPAESQVAILLTEGKSVEDIAKRQRVALATVRAHLKNIFGKTGTHRQAPRQVRPASVLAVEIGHGSRASSFGRRRPLKLGRSTSNGGFTSSCDRQ